MSKGTITKVSGQFLAAEGLNDSGLYDVVRFPHRDISGEIIGFENGEAIIHLFDRATDIELGHSVVSDKGPVTIELGPGLLGKVYDGIGRPLDDPDAPRLDHEKLWDFKARVNVGDEVFGGDVLGTVAEDDKIIHKILVPHNVSGTVRAVNENPCKLTDIVVSINGHDNALHEISIMHKWPIRAPRPFAEKLLPGEPIVTLQRAIDAIYPIAKGSITAICGGYSTGKTTLEYQIASSVDVDVLVYVGCGERGNEMLHILDILSSKAMTKKSVIIATTADMNPAMREASLYTGVTIAEYYREMGCNVVLIADSLSVWQESLLSAYPDEHEVSPYLARIYERVGRVAAIGREAREGTITFIASSDRHPDPATERCAKVMLTLDSALAEKKHFPAIDAIRSYSLYAENTREWFNKNVNDNWGKFSSKFTKLLGLAPDADIDKDTLSDAEKLIDRTVSVICDDFITQDAHEEIYGCSLDKQYKYMRLIYDYYRLAKKTLDDGAPVEALTSISSLDEIAAFKHTEDKDLGSAYRNIIEHLNSDVQKAATREEGR